MEESNSAIRGGTGGDGRLMEALKLSKGKNGDVRHFSTAIREEPNHTAVAVVAPSLPLNLAT